MSGLRWRQWWTRFIAHLQLFLFGAAMSWVAAPYQQRRRRELERMFVMITGAALLGVPCVPASGVLRLLPYFVPNALSWRRSAIFRRELEGVDLKHIGH